MIGKIMMLHTWRARPFQPTGPNPEAAEAANGTDTAQWSVEARQDGAEVDEDETAQPERAGRMQSLKMLGHWAARLPTAPALPTLCVALGAITFALIAWRGEVVRLMPQTGSLLPNDRHGCESARPRH